MSIIGNNLRRVLRYLLGRVARVTIGIPLRRRLARFEAATHDPLRAQQALLEDILAHQAATDFGRDHHFGEIRDVGDFRRHLPVAPYDYFEPYLARVRQGQTNALLADAKIHMFALTSGTTSTRKYIPVNDAYLATYRQGWNIWGIKNFIDHPRLKLRPIVQMSGDWEEYRTEAGIPCGSVTGLTAKMQGRLVRWLYCVPASVGQIKDAVAKYYLALRLSLPRQVAVIIAANPSTLINMAQLGDDEKESLLRDLRDGTLNTRFEIPSAIRDELAGKLSKRHPQRVKELEEAISKSGTLYPKDYWTKGCMLGNWTGGSMGAYLRHYPRYFGDFPIRDVGLIASEGRMTIPMTNSSPAGVLDVTSHYYEFIPEAEGDSEQPTVLGAHELEEGGRYFILLTTAYGLYRYHIHDLVRVTGFHNRTPLIEFLNKGAHFSNLTGEKLSEYQVSQAMVKVLKELDATLTAYSVAPCWTATADSFDQPYYGLFIESADATSSELRQKLAASLDRHLREMNVEYAGKQDSQRLGPLKVEVLPDGFWRRWDQERLTRTGGTLEQYKHPCLINDPQFAERAGR